MIAKPAALGLLCLLWSATAHADASVAPARWANATPWARTCAERLESARDEAAKSEPLLRRAAVEISVREEVLPLVEEVRLMLQLRPDRQDGVTLAVAPQSADEYRAGRPSQAAIDEYRLRNRKFRYEWDRNHDGRSAFLREQLPLPYARRAKLWPILERAADGCLGGAL